MGYKYGATWDTPAVDKVEFYNDSAGEWRWRYIVAENGEVLAVSSEGYKNIGDAQSAAERVIEHGTIGELDFSVIPKEG